VARMGMRALQNGKGAQCHIQVTGL